MTEKVVVAPPYVKKIEALEFTDPQIPGEIKIDASGKLLKKYFAFEGKVGSLVDQFNNFITNALPEHIQSRSLTLPNGIVTFENVSLNRPLTKSLKGALVPIFPQEARNLGYSYTADIYVDIVLNKGKTGEERIEKSFLGKVPVMLGSELDWLSTKSESERVALGENLGESSGGFFIIKGAEKLILIQEKLRANRIFLFNSTSKGNVICKITNNTIMGSSQITLAQGKKSSAFKIHLGFLGRSKGPSNKLGNTISVFQIFRMLGVSTAKEILGYISLFTKEENMKRLFVVLQPSFVKLLKIGDDIEYISKKKGLGKIDYDIRKSDIMNDLMNQLFPQISADNIQGKLYMLSMMIVRLGEYLIGVRELDDRDNWGNKQLVSAGKSMELLFASIWRELIIKVEDEIKAKNLNGLKSIKSLLESSFITENFIESFTANNWGVQSSYMTKENITDFLKRDSILAVYSHLGKINTPTSRKAKSPKIRMVQMSQLGYVDPGETPEGVQCLVHFTPVLMGDNTWRAIRDIREGDVVMTVNPYTLKREPSPITKPFTFHTSKSTKKMYKLISESGKEIQATGDHPFLTLRGWVEMDKLNLTDRVCVMHDENFHYEEILKILPDEHTQVCDFTTISDNHSFIANCFVTHNCGLVKNASMTMYASLDRPEGIVIELVNKKVFNKPTDKAINPFLLNGVFRGWVDGKELKDYCFDLKRTAKLAKDTAIVLERDGYFNIFTDSSRPTRPLLLVDTDGRLVIEKKNLWDADFNSLLREGCVEYVDAWEQENIMLAQSMDDVEARRRDIEMAIKAVQESEEKIRQFEGMKKEEEQILLSQAQANLKELMALPPYTHSEMDPLAILSIAIGIIPLPETNPGPRLTYQAGMGKQALGIYHSNHRSRFDTTSKILAYPSRPMFETQMNSVVGLDELPAGETVILAITTYTGFAQEDAIVMSKGAIDRGLFRSIVYKTYKTVAKRTKTTDEKFARPEIGKNEKKERYAAIDENGLPRLGAFVKEGDCLIGKIRKNMTTGKIENASSFVEVKQEGVVDKLLVSTNADGMRVVKVKIRQVRKPVIGDKFASRYAQKGTIGLIIPEEDMPFTAEGLKPDLIINPHCFPKSTPVSTHKGYSKRMGDFSAEGGERLWAWDEEKKSYVVSSSAGMESKGVKKLVNVHLEDGRVIKCTPDHKFLTFSNNRYVWVAAENLTRKHILEHKNGKLNIPSSRIVCGLEMPLDKPEEDIGSTWRLESGDDVFDMSTPLNREKSLAFARILGYTLTDGCVCKRDDLKFGYCSTLNMGHDIDAQAVQEDIFLLTGKNPTYTLAKGTVNIRLPASLSGAIGLLEGVQSGKRSGQEITLPAFLNDPNCPLSVIREFLGGLFGGDGIAPHIIDRSGIDGGANFLIQCGFSQTTQIDYSDALGLKMENIAALFERLGVKTSRIDGPQEIYYNEEKPGYKPADGIKRVSYTIQLENNSNFATKVGFRYCIQKSCRLSAAAAYWRYQEEIIRQHDWVVNRTNELYDSGAVRQRTNKKSIPLSLERAREELIQREPVINNFYSLSNITDIHNRRNKGGGSAKTLKKFLYTEMMDVKAFFTKMGCLHWFQRKDKAKMDYIVKRGSMEIPCFVLDVIGIYDAGEEEVFDIGVNDQHNFLAHGVVVHNCMPSRMTIGKLIEIVASKVAAFTGERVNATGFRKFDVNEFMRNLKQYGYSPSGKERLYSGYTGKPLEARIFIGPCYYQALRHQVEDKIQMRARGGISQLTHQPVGGRKRGGGQRFGEMERDAIISHGASAFLQERLCTLSDAYETVYCSTCGSIAIANPMEEKYVCRYCEDKATFGKIQSPFATKLLFQLLIGAGIQTKFKMREVEKK